MDKNVNMTLLLDFYGDILTDKQRESSELYYNEDLSLAEIAEITGITRAGIRDRLVKSEEILTQLEEKLGLAERFTQMEQSLNYMIDRLEKIKKNKIESAENIDDIIETARKLLM